MYNNNTINEGYKTLSPDGLKNPKLVDDYNSLVEQVEYEDMFVQFPDVDDLEYLNKLEEEYYRRNPESLNEAEWWYVSPFFWMKNIKLGGIGNIFKPLKWLAALVAGGLGILLGVLYKLLKAGKKQLAIAKVRAWIERLVVIADGGYKKHRKDKDSLFLIQARARRDILQAAVMCGYAAGLDIPEKNSEPANAEIESAKNESYSCNYNPFLVDTEFEVLNEAKKPKKGSTEKPKKGSSNLSDWFKGYRIKEDSSKVFNTPEEMRQYIAQKGLSLKNLHYQGMYTGGGFVDLKPADIFPEEEMYSMDKFLTGQEDVDKTKTEGLMEWGFNPEEIEEFMVRNVPFPNTENGIKDMFEQMHKTGNINDEVIHIKLEDGKSFPEEQYGAVQQWLKNKLLAYERLDKERLNKLINENYKPEQILPNDDNVDWSLMKTLTASSWFGLVKHKTNLWAEARSAAKFKLQDINDESTRQRYVSNILMNVNATLSKLTTPTIAKTYSNLLNQFVNSLMQRDTSKNQLQNTGQAANLGGLRVGNHGSSNEGMDAFIYDYNSLNEANNASQGRIRLEMTPEEWETYRSGMSGGGKIEYDTQKNIFDNCNKTMQNIFSTASVHEFLVFTKTRDQMTNFLNELEKSVHLIIETVAKKAAQMNSGNSGNGTANSLLGFLTSDSADPKQNRSLRNLWDNIARPKLDSRAITRCFELPQSPEFMYLSEMLSKTIPLCLMTLFMGADEEGQKNFQLLAQDGTAMKIRDVIKNNAKRLENQEKQKLGQNNEDEILKDTVDGATTAVQDSKDQDANNTRNNSGNDASTGTTPDSSTN